MIRTIKAEFRKNIRRPAVRVGTGLVAALVGLRYGVTFYEALNPSVAPKGAASVATLYPDQLVNNLVSAAFLSAAIAMVVAALMAGSEYSWGTLKTALTQRAGRLATVGGRLTALLLWTAVLTLVIFAVGAIASLGVDAYEGISTSWPAAIDLVKGFGAIWLVLSVSGLLGTALGFLFRQPAAAVGVGLIYGLALQVIVVRFIAGLSDGAYKWIADLFEGQNSNALLNYFTSPVFGPVHVPDISEGRAVLVRCAYVAAYAIGTAAIVRQRDVT